MRGGGTVRAHGQKLHQENGNSTGQQKWSHIRKLSLGQPWLPEPLLVRCLGQTLYKAHFRLAATNPTLQSHLHQSSTYCGKEQEAKPGAHSLAGYECSGGSMYLPRLCGIQQLG